MSSHPVRIMDTEVDALTAGDVLDRVRDGLVAGEGGWIATPNLDQLRQIHRQPDLGELIGGASIVVADGMPLVWASHLQGTPLPERVAGSDLVWSLASLAAELGVGLFLLGGNPESVASAAGEQLRERFPGLRIDGVYSPPFGFERDPAAKAELHARIAACDAAIVYVALGFPKQDRLIAELRREAPDKWFLGCGISLSFIAGDVRRAPPLLRRAGLEWLHRLSQEPQRLVSRYLVHDLPFFLRLLMHAARRRFNRNGRDPGV